MPIQSMFNNQSFLKKIIILHRTNLDLKSRIFSLRLIMQILQTSGPVFRSSEDFLRIIKTNLCVSLSRNGVSSIPELFEMALFNFVELLDKFKAHLKIQIEVKNIF
jgi:brefeldin A-inhibited guanine nucleotide-exchange protein